MTNSWDQQSKESSRAFSVFVAYRDLGLRRSCGAVARQLSMNASSVLELSKRHRWQERVKAWDAHVDKENQSNQVQAVKIMKERQIALALKAQKAASKGLNILLKQFNAEPGQAMRPDGLAKLMDMGCRIERLNRDEPEQNIELLQQLNYENLSLEEMETMRGLITKAENK
jgi:hypothetical protein